MLGFVLEASPMTYTQFPREIAPRDIGDRDPGLMAELATPEYAASEYTGSSGAAVGLRGRRAFLALRLWRRTQSPLMERLYWHFLKPVLALALIVWYAPQYGSAIKRQFNIGIRAQLSAQWRLAFRDWVNPRCYYFHEHYRRLGSSDIDAYVMRHEIKQGLLKALHKMRPKVHGVRVNLGHKLAFAEACARFGVPTPAILAFARRGGFYLGIAHRETFSGGIFVKPELGRGARGARAHRRTETGLYHLGTRRAVKLDRLIAAIMRRSFIRPLLVQPLLENHPDIRDLAGTALISFRVFTCIDPNGIPRVTHAMLRSLSKLEPDWPGGEEFAAPVDLATGRLGLMCGDSNLAPNAWLRHHPVTGAAVADRIVLQWPAIRDLAVAVHQVFRDRMIVGWDIALTPDGPVVLEGNSYPDTEFLQRVHRQPIGKSPLGPLLQHHLGILEARRGGFRADLNAAP
jgi:hypothetical protein